MTGVMELMLADSRTPAGGYAHSGGLEQAVADGLLVQDVPAFVRARLRTVGRAEAVIAGLACVAPDTDALLALDLEWAARTPAEPLRAASRRLGLALLRVASTWWPDDVPLARYTALSELTPRPVVLGAVARRSGLARRAAVRLSLYEDAAAVLAAAVKLLPVDGARTSAWLLGLSDELEALAAAAAADDLTHSAATPMLDARALVHATSERRLFAS